MGWFGMLFRHKPEVEIRNPKLGLLNLLGERGAELLTEDRASFGPLFSEVAVSVGDPPACDVLVCYCEIGAAGQLGGYPGRLRELIREAGAYLVVVATENAVERYMESAVRTGYGEANLVMTLHRRGTHFGVFFERLFRHMLHGETMPRAWAKLVPQVGGKTHQDTPETVFACELGHIGFSS